MGAQKQTQEAGAWSCYVCNEHQLRVIEIPEARDIFYCEGCLFNAVRDGKLTLSSHSVCNECGDQDSDLYCPSCAPSTCYNCGEATEVYCSDCTWEDHSCSDNCEHSCGEPGCWDTASYYYCESCWEATREEIRSEVRDELAEEREEEQARVTTEDGRDFTLDDGVVIRWTET